MTSNALSANSDAMRASSFEAASVNMPTPGHTVTTGSGLRMAGESSSAFAS